MLVGASMVFAALTWFPGPGWSDRPDPAASPYAVKGGTIRFNGSQPPKSHNAYVDNNSYTKMTFDLMYENLLGVDSETSEFVPALARRWAVSDDGAEFVFELDDRARWSDGTPVTAEDVKWTFDTVMSPKNDTGAWKIVLGEFDSPEVVGERTVRFRKKGESRRDWRDLMKCAMFWIMPKHAFGDCDFNKLDLTKAVVSGPYTLSREDEQVETEFERVRSWWRRDFPSCRNICNFDRIVMRYYADNDNAFEALKKREIDVYPVYSAKVMAKDTNGDKFKHNWILKRRVRNHRPVGFQGFAMNMRRKPFDDRRVREAMAMLIDRETMNRTMMFSEYFLMKSYYTDVYDAAHPCENRLYPYDVEAAKALLKEAGYENGFKFTFLSRSPGEDKFLSLFTHALEQCNIKMEIVRKDFAAWMRDMDEFNFDMTWQSWGAGLFKDPETMWLSSEEGRKGSNNTIGFKSAAVDALIAAEKSMTSAADRDDAYRRIDALIAAECPYALLWNIDCTRLLYWNKFGMPPAVLARHSDEDGVLTYWWYDEDRVRELKESVSEGGFLPTVPETVVYDEVMAK